MVDEQRYSRVPIVPICPKLFSEIVQPEEFHRRICCQSAPISHMFPSPSSFRANINLTYLAHIDSIALLETTEYVVLVVYRTLFCKPKAAAW